MALELARSGVPLRAVIGFHPGFAKVSPKESAGITASVLMICGATDDHRIGQQAAQLSVTALGTAAKGSEAATDEDLRARSRGLS